MGTAWHCSAAYPWESGRYQGGIETVKINIALRIYANKWHVYAGLAILNPSARVQINQYAKSTTELFKLMVEGKGDELRARVKAARASVFGDEGSKRTPILLSDKILDQFSLGPKPSANSDPSSTPAAPRNSHLSLLAMVDCWHVLQILPLFRMWIGVAEYLFRDEARLEAAVAASLEDREHRSDDTEFVVAARGWSQCVEFGSWEMYRERFERTAGELQSSVSSQVWLANSTCLAPPACRSAFFAPRFEEATRVGSAMIKTISASAPPTTQS
jgi:prephenate dehydrogenase (NADP+)